MPYYRNIPGAAQSISGSQPQLLNNTNVVDDSFNRDHVPHADAFEGKHTDIHFKLFAIEPPANTEANDIEIFNFTSTLTGIPELFVRKGVAAHGIPFTAKGGTFNHAAATPSLSWTYLPSGVIIKCGRVTEPGALTNVNLNPAADVPHYANPPLVFLTVSDTVPGSYLAYAFGVFAGGFSLRLHANAVNTRVNWLTIGV